MSQEKQEPKTIKQLRQELGISQFDLATIAGISLSTVIGAERATHLPRIDHAIQIAQALKVTVHDIAWGIRE
jgi:DNA-binding XRE family transcriptional regulator